MGISAALLCIISIGNLKPKDVNDAAGSLIIRQAKQQQGVPHFKNIFNSASERARLKEKFESNPKNANYLPG